MEEGRAGEWFSKAFKLSPLMHLLNKVSCSEKHIRDIKIAFQLADTQKVIAVSFLRCDKIILLHISLKTGRKVSSLEKKTLRVRNGL